MPPKVKLLGAFLICSDSRVFGADILLEFTLDLHPRITDKIERINL